MPRQNKYDKLAAAWRHCLDILTDNLQAWEGARQAIEVYIAHESIANPRFDAGRFRAAVAPDPEPDV